MLCIVSDFGAGVKIKAIADTLRANLAELLKDSASDARLATAASCDAPHGRSSNLAGRVDYWGEGSVIA